MPLWVDREKLHGLKSRSISIRVPVCIFVVVLEKSADQITQELNAIMYHLLQVVMNVQSFHIHIFLVLREQ